MKIIAVSDLHGYLPTITESCDLFVIAGDILPLPIQEQLKRSKDWINNKFLPWINKLDCTKVVLVAGNHDIPLETHSGIFNKTKVTYLQDKLIEFKGYKIYGTPWCKQFGRWAFMAQSDILQKYYEPIPKELDLLITHDVPYTCNDVIIEPVHWANEHIGNMQLLEVIVNKKPKNLCCGHLHGVDHTPKKYFDTMIYPCSLLNEQYKPVYNPQIFEI